MARYFVIFPFLLCAAARAGAAVTLLPAAPANGIAYMPGESVNVEVMVQLTAGTPSVPGPVGTATSIRVRFLQFDFSDSTPGLDIRPVSHHPGSDLGPIPFWNFSGSSACANDESNCGTNYFIDGNLSDDLVNIIYVSQNPSGSEMITLTQIFPKRVAEFSVTLPLEPCGEYRLDVLNADDNDPNHGAEIRWGFGSTADPTDPTSPMRAYTVTAGGGGIGMTHGQTNGITWSAPPCIPEPTTLALLVVGGLAIARRKPRIA